jgi:hypothetical protein
VPPVFVSSRRRGRRNGEIAVVKIVIPKLIFAAAVLAAATCLEIPAALAGGDAPWCAIIDYGDGGVTWECVYRTFEECYPNVLAGNKGFCNVNPYGPGPSPTPAAYHKQRKRHVQQ